MNSRRSARARSAGATCSSRSWGRGCSIGTVLTGAPRGESLLRAGVSGARDRRGIDRSPPQAYLLFCAANDRQLLLNLSAAPRRWPGRNPDSAGAMVAASTSWSVRERWLHDRNGHTALVDWLMPADGTRFAHQIRPKSRYRSSRATSRPMTRTNGPRIDPG